MPYEVLLSDSKLIKSFKTQLEKEQKFVRPIYQDGDYKVIRTTIKEANDPFFIGKKGMLREYTENGNDEQENGLVGFTKKFFGNYDVINEDELIQCLPLRYTVYPPLLLFNNSSKRSYISVLWNQFFQHAGDEVKNQYFEELLSNLFRHQNLTHVAINMPIIETDVMRRPFNIYPLYGELISPILDLMEDDLWNNPTEDNFKNTLWCHTIQNGIHQFWAPMFTMFSRGNIKEKKRILDTFPDIENNDIVDLYAGIGYFTLCYLKKGARNVFCFELNPWSVEALKKGLKANSIDPRKCNIYNESNEMCLKRIKEKKIENLRIRHINLGLLPTSKPGWHLSLEIIALQKFYTPLDVVTLHIHENVHASALDDGSFIEQVLHDLSDIDSSFSYTARHLEKIKTYAPDVWHICLDVDVTNDTYFPSNKAILET